MAVASREERATLLTASAIDGEERREIAARVRGEQERAPHVEAGERVVDLGLHEQPLRLRDVVGGGELRLEPRGGLFFGVLRRLQRVGRIARDLERAIEERLRALRAAGQLLRERLFERVLAR